MSSRARNWLRALKRQALAVFGVPALDDLIAAFDRLVNLGRVPVSRATKNKKSRWPSFASA